MNGINEREEPDYYAILNIDETATAADIKKAYRKLTMIYHPDKNPGDPTATKKFQEISSAYEVLGDEQKRKNYDLSRDLHIPLFAEDEAGGIGNLFAHLFSSVKATARANERSKNGNGNGKHQYPIFQSQYKFEQWEASVDLYAALIASTSSDVYETKDWAKKELRVIMGNVSRVFSNSSSSSDFSNCYSSSLSNNNNENNEESLNESTLVDFVASLEKCFNTGLLSAYDALSLLGVYTLAVYSSNIDAKDAEKLDQYP